jgi:hypothetical protein
LNFNHPCKELIWVVQPEDNVNDCANKYGGKQWFNYTDNLDKTYYTGTPSDPFGGGMGGANAAAMWNNQALPLFGTTDNNENFTEQGQGSDCSGEDVSTNGGIGAGTGNQQAFNVQSAFPNSLAGVQNPLVKLPLFDQGKNPTSTAKLQLNGHDRFSEREGRYFNLVQPYQHHTNVPATGINVYSFGLKPEEHQPSGTCNMSRIDNATLQLNVTHDTVKSQGGAKAFVYATNYNVLRIMSGMGGLAYSN